ncbi:hypothetical protein ACQ4PT_031460 [Festuca glaucescens]
MATPGDVPSMAAKVDAPSMMAPVDAPSVTAPIDAPSKAAPGDAPTKAAPGPGLYSEIGKKARDLVNKDFNMDPKFTLTTYAENGAAITATSTKKDEAILSQIQTQFKYNNVKLDVKANSDSQVLITATTEYPRVPGMKHITTIPFPFKTPGKNELQYQNDYAGLSLGVGMNSKPLINFSGVVGNKSVAVGGDVAYDTAIGDLTKYNAGVSLTKEDLVASVMLNNKGDCLSASCYYMVNKQSAVGGELTHSFSSKENMSTVALQHSLDPLTTVKARYNNKGMVSGLIQHEWRPKSLLTISTEFDAKAIEKSSKIGLSLVLKP